MGLIDPVGNTGNLLFVNYCMAWGFWYAKDHAREQALDVIFIAK